GEANAVPQRARGAGEPRAITSEGVIIPAAASGAWQRKCVAQVKGATGPTGPKMWPCLFPRRSPPLDDAERRWRRRVPQGHVSARAASGAPMGDGQRQPAPAGDSPLALIVTTALGAKRPHTPGALGATRGRGTFRPQAPRPKPLSSRNAPLA